MSLERAQIAGYVRTVAGRRRYTLRHSELDSAIDDTVGSAVEAFDARAGGEYLREILVSGLGLAADGATTGDLKLINSALRELRRAFRVFAPFRKLRKVAVFGSARTPPDHPDWEQARAFAERIVAEGWMVITGAGPGIMQAAQGGAGREASFGVNIRLPFEQSANEIIARDSKLVNFRYFFTRKVVFVKEAHAIALFPGGFGTHDEGFEALTLMQTGKSEILPLCFVDSPGSAYWREWLEYVDSHLRARGLIDEEDLALFRVTDSIDDAVAEILEFYSNYHSSRYVGDRLVIRVHRAPTPEQLDGLNADFGDLLTGGAIECNAALPEEAGEVDHFPRVTLRFNRRDVGRLRRLIDQLNALVAEHASPPGEAAPHEIVEEPLPEERVRREEA